MSALKTRLAWTTSFAFCAALLGAGCDTGPADEPVIETVEPSPPGVPSTDMGTMDRSGEMRGMPGGAVADPGADSFVPAEPAPIDSQIDEPTAIEPPADEPAPIEDPAPADPPADDPAPVEPEPSDPGIEDEPGR